MPKMGPGKGRRGGGGRLTNSFNAVAADPTISHAFDSNAFSSNAFDGDAKIGSNFSTSHTSPWSGR